MAEPEFYWTGASGKQYAYWSYKLPFSCDAVQNGNYIVTKIVDKVWFPIYIGQGDLNDRVNDETHYSCAIRKGATHVHVHLNPIEKNRIAEEQDLLAGVSSYVYAPTGCNEKPGG